MNQPNNKLFIKHNFKHTVRYNFLQVALIIVILDQVTKYFARSYLIFGQTKVVVQGFWGWTLAYNKGAAFSFLNNDDVWPKVFFGVIAVAVAIWLVNFLLHRTYSLLTGISFSFILGGAIGNLVDRIIFAKVTDFIDWYYHGHHWPAFNLADSFICVGVFLLIIENLFFAKEER